MVVITHEGEIDTTIPPAKMFKAFALDGGNIIPKAAPQAIESIVNLEGDGGPGTIKHVTFHQGTGFKYVKERVDLLDKENFAYNFTMIEGDVLMNTYEKISNEVKFEPAPDGGSICKNNSKYHTIGDANQINQEEIKAFKEKQLGLFKAIEAYLLANPDA